MERGVAVAIKESAQQFVLDWPCLWNEQDVEVTTELAEALKVHWPKVGTLRFDAGFGPKNSPAMARRPGKSV